MDKRNKRCVHCGDEFELDLMVKDQRYCRKEGCQKVRRAFRQVLLWNNMGHYPVIKRDVTGRDLGMIQTIRISSLFW